MGDVLNLGTVKTSKLYIEGKNVKVLNTDDVMDASGTALTGANVTIRSEETPHIGYDVGHKVARNFTVNGGTVTKNVSDYKNANDSKSATSRHWDVKKLDGTAYEAKSYDYMRVHNVYELQYMDANQIDDVDPDKKILGRYMLADDIAASETKDWDRGFQPIGDTGRGAFRGQFDGVGHTITGLTIKAPDDEPGRNSRGMFAYTYQALIENVSLKDASVTGVTAVGGIVGIAEFSTIRNVSFIGKVYGNGDVGGIVGQLKQGGSRIENAYHEGTVEGNDGVGGIVGYVFNNSTVQNVRNAGKVVGNAYLGGIAGLVEDSSVRNALQTGTVEQRSGQGDSNVGGVVGSLEDGSKVNHAVWKEGSVTNGSGALIQDGIGKVQGNGTAFDDVQKCSEAQMKLAATYAGWGSDVATEGGKGTPWRIYDGKTVPLLTAFLRTKHLANREKVYDGTAPTIAGGDGITWTAGKDAGTYHAYSEEYDITGGAYTVKPKELTLGFTSYARFDKTYDGGRDTITRTLTKGMHYRLTGFVAGDGSDVELAGGVTGTYADKNAGKDKEVTFQNLALTGTGAKNYTVKKAQGVGTIAPKQLTLDLVGSTRFDKTYDGNANVAQSLTKGTHYTLTGFVTGDGTDVALASATGTYTAGKNAGADKEVTFKNLTLTGTGAGNYTLDKTSLTSTGTIDRRALTLGAVAAQTKTYDGTTAADASKFGAALAGAVAGDNVTAAAAGATYNSKDVATANTVNYTGVQLTGAEAGNYTLAATTAQGAGTITKRALTLGVAAQTKTYDGNVSADATKFRATLGNLVAGEENSVTATAAGASYNDKNVAGASKVNYTGVQLTGTGAANYSIANTAQGAGRITPKQLNLALAGGARFDKTYDGNANVRQALTKGTNYTLTNFVTGEGTGIELDTVTGKYADKNAAADKAVTFGGLTLKGTGAGNYTLDKTALTGKGTIARRALTLGEVAAQSKTYDGTTAADASKFGAALAGTIAGDNVTAAATGATYNDKNVDAANRIDYTGVALRGADAGNYSIASTAQGEGTITHRDLTLTAAPRSIVQGEALPSFTGRADGFADGEDERVFGADGITFGTTVTNTDTPGSYGVTGRVVGVSDGVFGNYRIRQAAGNATAFTVNAAALPGGLLASLVQDAAPQFDMGFGDSVYLFGTPRPIRTATLGLYRFATARDVNIEGVRLD